MKRKIFLGAMSAAILLFFSCAGGPEPTPKETVPEAKTPETTTKTVEKPAETKVPAPEKELSEARQLRERVLRFELDKVAAEEFAAAEAQLKAGEAAYDKDNTAAKTALDGAIAGYRKIIQAGFSQVIGKLKNEIEKVKKEADAVKAAKALPEDYKAAQDAYQGAQQDEKAGEFEKSLAGYEKTKALFVDVRDRAIDKKQRAEKALQEAKAGITNAETKAKQLETELKQGGAQ